MTAATATPKAKTTRAAKPRAKKAADSATPESHKLRIRVRAYEHKILDVSVKQIMDTAARFDAKVVGPVPLPTEIKRWTVNRSTFVHKDAREQFEMRIHKRLIDILNPNPKVIEALTNLNLPSGVSIDVKMV
jgi:small subunit ribosomal protein S10